MTIKSPGSQASRAFLGLGDMKSGMLHDAVPVVLGGGLAVGTGLGLRQFVSPATSPGLYKWAPLIGAGAGGVVGGAISYFLAGGKRSGMGAAVASVISALIAGGGLWAADLMLEDQTPAERSAHVAALTAGATAALPSGTQQGVTMRRDMGEIHASAPGVSGAPRVLLQGGVNQSAYGSAYGG